MLQSDVAGDDHSQLFVHLLVRVLVEEGCELCLISWKL